MVTLVTWFSTYSRGIHYDGYPLPVTYSAGLSDWVDCGSWHPFVTSPNLTFQGV